MSENESTDLTDAERLAISAVVHQNYYMPDVFSTVERIKAEAFRAGGQAALRLRARIAPIVERLSDDECRDAQARARAEGLADVEAMALPEMLIALADDRRPGPVADLAYRKAVDLRALLSDDRARAATHPTTPRNDR